MLERDDFGIDRNLTNNLNYIRQAFGEDSHLITSLLCFIAWKHRNQLFHVGILDPYEFSKMSCYQPGYLRRKHNSPAQLERMKEKDIRRLYLMQENNPLDFSVHIFDNLLENALYLLYTRSITYPGNHVIYQLNDGNELHKVNLEKITFFRQLKIIWHRSKSGKGKDKIYYEYELDQSFVHNLSLYYLNCNLQSFVILRKKRLDTLYLFVKNLREYFIYHNKVSDVVSFQTLCEVAQLNRADVRMRKQDLIKAFKVLSEFANFPIQLSFVPSDKGFYLPLIIFPEACKPTPDALIAERQHLLYLNFLRYLMSSFKDRFDYFLYKELDILPILIKYIKECTQDNLRTVYCQAQITTFRKLTDKAVSKFDDFYLKLLKVNTPEQLFRLFVSENIPITFSGLQRKYTEVRQVSEDYKKNLGWRFNLQTFADKENYKVFEIGNDIYLCR